MSHTVTRTAISAIEAQAGDVLITFHIGRVTVASVEQLPAGRVAITTTTGRRWETSATQLVYRQTIA